MNKDKEREEEAINWLKSEYKKGENVASVIKSLDAIQETVLIEEIIIPFAKIREEKAVEEKDRQLDTVIEIRDGYLEEIQSLKAEVDLKDLQLTSKQKELEKEWGKVKDFKGEKDLQQFKIEQLQTQLKEKTTEINMLLHEMTEKDLKIKELKEGIESAINGDTYFETIYELEEYLRGLTNKQ